MQRLAHSALPGRGGGRGRAGPLSAAGGAAGLCGAVLQELVRFDPVEPGSTGLTPTQQNVFHGFPTGPSAHKGEQESYGERSFRCYVEKKPGFAVEAAHLFGELRRALGLTGLAGVRILRRYDVEGWTAARLCRRPHHRPLRARRWTPCGMEDHARPGQGSTPSSAVEALPGQYDQRADSCAQCIQLMHRRGAPPGRAPPRCTC
ncbi:MAG: hypothetical protein ACLRWQ_16835 [Flavonifractor plautii]